MVVELGTWRSRPIDPARPPCCLSWLDLRTLDRDRDALGAIAEQLAGSPEGVDAWKIVVESFAPSLAAGPVQKQIERLAQAAPTASD